MAALAPNAVVGRSPKEPMRIQGAAAVAGERARSPSSSRGARASGDRATSKASARASTPLDPSATRPVSGTAGDQTCATRDFSATRRHHRSERREPEAQVGVRHSDVTQSRSQPAVVGGKLFMASQCGRCLRARSEDRLHLLDVQGSSRAFARRSPWDPSVQRRRRLCDLLRRRRGARVRRRRRDGQGALGAQGRRSSAARATGSPTLHDGRLYVVLSGVSKKPAASMPDYECCTFRGSLTALDATSGASSGRPTRSTSRSDAARARAASRSGDRPARRSGAHRRSTRSAASSMRRPATPTPTRRRTRATRSSRSTSRPASIRWVNQIMPDVWILGCSGATARGRRPNDGERQSELPRGRRTRLRFLGVARARHAGEWPRRTDSSTQKSGVGYCSTRSGAAA